MSQLEEFKAQRAELGEKIKALEATYTISSDFIPYYLDQMLHQSYQDCVELLPNSSGGDGIRLQSYAWGFYIKGDKVYNTATQKPVNLYQEEKLDQTFLLALMGFCKYMMDE